MTIPFATPQDFDTVNFSGARNLSPAQVINNEVRAARMGKLALVVYGGISLRPHQVLDVIAFRPGKALAGLLDLAPQGVVRFVGLGRNDVSFVSHLEGLLRRSGPDAFIFSHTPDGTQLAEEWGSLVRTYWSNTELFRKAEKFSPVYGAVYEFARKCDEREMRIRTPSVTIASYSEYLAKANQDYLSLESLPNTDLPATRSNAQQRVVRKLHSPESLPLEMARYDLVYNLMHADQMNAIPLLGTSSFNSLPDLAEAKYVYVSLADPNNSYFPCPIIEIRYKYLTTHHCDFINRLDCADFSTVFHLSAHESLNWYRSEAWQWLTSLGERLTHRHIRGAEDAFNRLFNVFDELLSHAHAAEQRVPSVVSTVEGETLGEIVIDDSGIHYSLKVAEVAKSLYRMSRSLIRWRRKPNHHSVALHSVEEIETTLR